MVAGPFSTNFYVSVALYGFNKIVAFTFCSFLFLYFKDTAYSKNIRVIMLLKKLKRGVVRGDRE